MSDLVKQVVGIELCESAVVDARANATLNNITNAIFFASKAEAVRLILL